jgi:hypothetical protein
MKLMISLLSIFIICSYSYAQSLTLLEQIGQPPVNTQSGLSQIFTGDLLNDGNLYFLGSHDGLKQQLWRTDGTPGGTFKIFEESNIDSWQAVRFAEDGVFFNIGDHLIFYKAGMLPFRNLGPFQDVTFVQPEKMDSSRYIFLAHRNDTAGLVISDLTADGSFYLGDIGNYHGFMTLYASPFGAVVYHTNAFVDYEPMMYDAIADSILTVKDFLAPYKTISGVKKVALHDHYLFLEVSEGGTKQYLFDLRTNTFYPGQYFFGIIEYFYPYGDDLIIVSEREITRMDTTTYHFTEYTDEVFPLGTHLLTADKIYYHGYSTNDTVYVFELNLTSGDITRLPGGQIGKNYYGSRFAVHEDELYYLRDFGPTTFLTRYDFTDSVAVDIDSITVRNGGLVINNALIEVKGELLVSKFSPEEWHELYFLEATTHILDPIIVEVRVFPNPCNDLMRLDLQDLTVGEIWIWDGVGQLVCKQNLENGVLQTQHLVDGVYHGIVLSTDKKFRFSFVKQE